VHSVSDYPVTFGGDGPVGWLPPGAAPPSPTPRRSVRLDIEVRAETTGFLLQWQPSAGDGAPHEPPYAGDEWYQDLQDALAAANDTFGLSWT